MQHILNQATVKSAGSSTWLCEFTAVDKKKIAFGGCNYTDRKSFYLSTGKRFGKQIATPILARILLLP